MVERDRKPLNVGRRQRTVSGAIRRALVARDRTCTFPGCHHERFLEGHHVHHWAEGGETSLENLVLLCSTHHALVHEGGYSVKRREDGSCYFARPDGRPVETKERYAGLADAPPSAEGGNEVREIGAGYRIVRAFAGNTSASFRPWRVFS